MRSLRICAVGLTVSLGIAFSAASQSVFQAKCIGITDGDTLTVLQNNRQVKLRLFGIDAPEPGEPFSQKAKKFLSSLASGRTVLVEPVDNDRYGRTVARVFVGTTDLSVALLRAGLAWHYTKYSSRADLAEAEAVAKAAELGIWSLPNPVPPWELTTRPSPEQVMPERQTLKSGTGAERESRTIYHGNIRSHVFHAPWCRYYNCSN